MRTERDALLSRLRKVAREELHYRGSERSPWRGALWAAVREIDRLRLVEERFEAASMFARCPGCGDHADVAHVAECCAMRIRSMRESRADELRMAMRRGARWMLGVAVKQARRREAVDLGAMLRALTYQTLAPRRR